MSESGMRSKLVLRCNGIDMKPVENKCHKGWPDVNYIEGNAELKWLRGWPKQDGPVTIPHYTNHQRLWLNRRWQRGGKAFLVMQVKLEWLVIAGCDAAPVGYLTRSELYSICIGRWSKFNLDEFKALITMPMAELEQLRKKLDLCNCPILKNFSYNDAAKVKTSTTRRRAGKSATTVMLDGSVLRDGKPRSPTTTTAHLPPFRPPGIWEE